MRHIAQQHLEGNGTATALPTIKTSKGEVKCQIKKAVTHKILIRGSRAREQKPGNQPNQPVKQKQQVPGGQPKSPQSEQEKHDQEKQSKLRVHWIYSGTDGSGRSG
jgi:hypothetical protein